MESHSITETDWQQKQLLLGAQSSSNIQKTGALHRDFDMARVRETIILLLSIIKVKNPNKQEIQQPLCSNYRPLIVHCVLPLMDVRERIHQRLLHVKRLLLKVHFNFHSVWVPVKLSSWTEASNAQNDDAQKHLLQIVGMLLYSSLVIAIKSWHDDWKLLQ